MFNICVYDYLYIFVWLYYDSKHVLCVCTSHGYLHIQCNLICLFLYLLVHMQNFYMYTVMYSPYSKTYIHIVGMYALYVHIYDHTSVETSGYCTVLKTNTEDSSRFSDSLASLCRFRAGQRTSGLVSTSLTLGPVVDGQNPAQIGVFNTVVDRDI